jgi:hypothetical protein
MTINRATPASITMVTVTAITTPPALLIQGLLEAVDSPACEHSFAQTSRVTDCPLFSVNSEIPLDLIKALSCLALLPLKVAEKVPSLFDLKGQSIATSSTATSTKPNSFKIFR